MRRVRIAAIVVAVATIAGGLVALVVALGLYLDRNDPPDLEFEATAWQSATRSSGVRYQMADDLIDSGVLTGMNRSEVLALLGEPSSASGNRSEYVLGGPIDAFLEGFENLLAADFDASGRVERVFRHGD